MKKGGGMQAFNRGRKWNMVLVISIQGSGRHQRDQGADAFTARLNQVLANFLDEIDLRSQL
jgi:hypothetical protein